MRKVNEMFHIEGEQLIKTSNGEPVPNDEPLFILRGRDRLAAQTIAFYCALLLKDNVPQDRVLAVQQVAFQFRDFSASNKAKMKQPGITHGK